VRFVKKCLAHFGSSDLGMWKGLFSMAGIRLRCCIMMSCYFQIVRCWRGVHVIFKLPATSTRRSLIVYEKTIKW